VTLEVDEQGLKQGVLALVVTLVEVIQDALETQALRRIEGGSLSAEEQERLGNALLELDEAMTRLKREHGLERPVADLRRGLDDVVEDLLDTVLRPEAARPADDAGPAR
jgi:hypothetical protein